MDVAGKPMLWHVVKRVEAVGIPAVVAVPNDDANGALRGWLFDHKIRYGSGPADDVLSRYYDVAMGLRGDFAYDTIVRVTADCPLVDPSVIAKTLLAYESAGDDVMMVGAAIGSYGAHGIFGANGYPDGLDVEVIRLSALRHAWANAISDSDREHVTPWLWKHGGSRCLKVFNNDLPHDNTKFSVDTTDDLLRVRAIYDAHYNKPDAIFPASRFVDRESHD